MTRRTSPSCQRNRDPILEVLRRVLPSSGAALEISCGTGEHAVHFSQALPGWTWQPSDLNPGALDSTASWAEDGPANMRAPVELDVTVADWGQGELDLVFNANMMHIAPWACAEGLFQGAGRHLRAGGLLITYGPYKVGGVQTAPSNERFDTMLRMQDPAWGIRDMEAVVALAEANGLRLQEKVVMPANNFTLVFVKGSS